MNWVGISGSWRVTNPQIEQAVRREVRRILLSGNGIVTGGALNVDYFATEEVITLELFQQVRIFLPTSFSIYAAHYRKRAEEGVITKQQAENLIHQLSLVQNKNPKALIGNTEHKAVTKDTYFERNNDVVNNSDELLAFQVNKSAGVQDTIEKAKEKGIPVQIFSYEIRK